MSTNDDIDEGTTKRFDDRGRDESPVVESFQLDHTKVKAPYVRFIDTETGPHGDVVSNYDLRLVQPNENAIPTAALHTIEHTLAVQMRKRIDGYIDCSPFGCRTGFHLLVWGEHDTVEIANALRESLEFIAYQATWDDVPATTIESCGNYRDHSLFGARQWSRDILGKGISSDPFERKVVSGD
ncbi:autoinducer-2 production protein [Bifidobacterium minimum]|uniref:S-ribosylhomocysteine lyase n=1 Tax=Bifidobacterium minimum TaxID=1693 RepID=A0A087BN08_9BIFI|nr:S-ribosylhomocysteine lyase [Bifidobacterium minimum]KFI72408.1 autoinducer-2 production protein [Bifidobacterium minimum]